MLVDEACLYFWLLCSILNIILIIIMNCSCISPVAVMSTQEKVIPPMTLSLKRNKNVPLCFFLRRDFSLPLLTNPMMRLQHMWKKKTILFNKKFLPSSQRLNAQIKYKYESQGWTGLSRRTRPSTGPRGMFSPSPRSHQTTPRRCQVCSPVRQQVER